MLREISDRVFRTGKQVEARAKDRMRGHVPMIKPERRSCARSTKAAADPVALENYRAKRGFASVRS